MCGVAGIIGGSGNQGKVEAMVARLRHRGPDAHGMFEDSSGNAVLGSTRLSIIDLSEAGRMPMVSSDRWHVIVHNGEIYNYRELRKELTGYDFKSETDTEVILAAFQKWGEKCLDRFIGMFAFVIWDSKEKRLFAARDRFGVKPLYYANIGNVLYVASEIKALHAAGVERNPDSTTWATYLATGVYDHNDRTFWGGVKRLPAGHSLKWSDGKVTIQCWYDLAHLDPARCDARSIEEVKEEYFELLKESVRLRFRSDVPVGINLSGGLDSSMLLGVVDLVYKSQRDVQAFTYVTGDERYDEAPWVEKMLEGTEHPWFVCPLKASEVPAFAMEVQKFQDEPFGGIPTLTYAKVFAEARKHGTVVLLDGQGMDEQWAGYDYYRKAWAGIATKQIATVQGTKQRSTRPECLTEEFKSQALDPQFDRPFSDPVQNVQYRDIKYTKLTRALRFSDRVSMQSSTELREPFLDHRLVELAFRQPVDRKIQGETGKWLLREIAKDMLPSKIVEAPKRPLQTPQREWLREDLKDWTDAMIRQAMQSQPGWFDKDSVQREWKEYLKGESDNSFYVWQWVNVGLMFGQE